MKTNFGKMERESYRLSKAFFESVWGDKSMRIHSECVIDACLNISKNTDLNKDIFIVAGWLHDLGRKKDKDTHHELSLGFLKDFLTIHPVFSKFQEEIEDCILNHRSDGCPKTIYGLIFKCADKVALHNIKWLKQ
jgi:HD superfamily phosphodiesterase